MALSDFCRRRLALAHRLSGEPRADRRQPAGSCPPAPPGPDQPASGRGLQLRPPPWYTDSAADILQLSSGTAVTQLLHGARSLRF